MKTEQQAIEQLAASMIGVGRLGGKIEKMTCSWFAPLKAMEVKTLDEANIVFSAAYEVNGWNQTSGRPPAGSTLTSAPPLVKIYTTTFRKGYKLELDVLSFETVGALRDAINEKRQPIVHRVETHKAPANVPHGPLGALWHEVEALEEGLTVEEQHEFEREVRMLMERFLRHKQEAA